MFRINIFLVCWSFQLFFFCKLNGGSRVKLPRYVIETDLKPVIFGSYSYDMIKGEFIINHGNSSTTEINLTDIIFSNTPPTTVIDDSYRKHVGLSATETLKSFNWWTQTRELLKNSTLYKYHSNRNKTINPRVKIKSQIQKT